MNKVRRVEIILPELFAIQEEVVNHPARFKVLACGRRFGKTTIAKEILFSGVLAGERCAYFSPSYRNASDIWKEAKATLYPITRDLTEHDYRLEAVTGGVLEVWSLSGSAGARELVRGRAYHRVCVDEAALLSDSAVWHGVIRPLLTDTRGMALFASTPRGRDGFFWPLFQLGQDPLRTSWQSWRFPTTANPYIDAAEVEEAKDTMPERFYREEYLAEFLEDGGVVFRNIDECCTGQEIPDAEDGHQYYFGVDWARLNDFTAISVFDITANRQVYLDRFNQVSWAVQRGRLAALYERYRPVVIEAESNSIGDPNIEALQAEGLPVRGFLTTQATKAALIESMALALERKEVVLLDDFVLKGELLAYTMARLPSGKYQYSAPVGGHDDTVIATALSLHGSLRRFTTPPIEYVEKPLFKSPRIPSFEEIVRKWERDDRD